MVTMYEMLPEIITLLCVIGFIIISRCFVSPIETEDANSQSLLNDRDFKSLRQEQSGE